MNAWEGQVIAIAVKELLESLKTLTRDGFGFPHRDRALLSAVIRDLLSEHPNIPRAEATLKQVESLAARPSADYYVARSLLTQVLKARANANRSRLLLSRSSGEGISRRSLLGGERPGLSSRSSRARIPPRLIDGAGDRIGPPSRSRPRAARDNT